MIPSISMSSMFPLCKSHFICYFFLLKSCNEVVGLMLSWSYILLLNREQYLCILLIYLCYSIAYNTCINYRFTCVIRLTCSTCMSTNLLTLFADKGTHNVYVWNPNFHSTVSTIPPLQSSIPLSGHWSIGFYYIHMHWISPFLSSPSPLLQLQY